VRRFLSLVVIAAAMLAGGVSPAVASVMLVPSKIQMVVTPGQVTSFTVGLENSSRGALSVSASAWDFARDAAGVPQPIDGTETREFRGCAGWLSFPADAGSASGGKTAVVAVNARVPSEAAPGSYSTYIRVLASPTDAKSSSVGLSYAFNALVVLTVVPPRGGAAGSAGTPVLKRSVSVAQVTAPVTAMNGSVPLNAVIVNDGNVHADVKTRFEVVSDGRVIESIPSKSFTLLPGDRYPLTATWSKPPLFGSYTARFVAEVQGAQPLTAESGFWVVSWAAILLATTSALVLAILVLTARRYVHIEFRKAGGQPATE
jgi:hypothetical protein